MTGIPALKPPGRIAAATASERHVSVAPVPLPVLRGLDPADGPRLSIALMDRGGRLQDRGAVEALGWQPGDRLLITLVKADITEVAQALAALTGEPHPLAPTHPK